MGNAKPVYVGVDVGASRTKVAVLDSGKRTTGVPPLAAPLRYRCGVCGYVYDPAEGIPESGIRPGTPFESLPDDWKCPVCQAGKGRFTALPP